MTSIKRNIIAKKLSSNFNKDLLARLTAALTFLTKQHLASFVGIASAHIFSHIFLWKCNNNSYFKERHTGLDCLLSVLGIR